MKKIGLVSVHNPNYGSLLQTYALQKYLLGQGYNNEIILYTKKKDRKQLVRIFNLPLLAMKMNVVIRDLKCFIFYSDIYKSLKIRMTYFNDFKKNLIFSRNYVGWNDLLNTNNEYDIFIIGSDQVWNPINTGTGFFNLLFTDDDKYRISYASSFGVSVIPQSQLKITKYFLNRINSISTREIQGKKIIKAITGKESSVVCDPTLLVDKSFWYDFIDKTRFISNKYIFCYFLGNNLKHREFANKFKEITGLPIVSLQHLDEFVKSDISFGDVKPYNVGPKDFVNLVANAEYIITDSFHGSIFSMLFKKSFYTLSRFNGKSSKSTNSRIDSLLEMAGIPERHIDTSISIEDCLNMKINYDIVFNRIDEFRLLSRTFINEAINNAIKKYDKNFR